MPYPHYKEFIGKRVVERQEKDTGPYDILQIFYNQDHYVKKGNKDYWYIIVYKYNRISWIMTPNRAFFEDGDLRVLSDAWTKITKSNNRYDMVELTKDIVYKNRTYTKGTQAVVLKTYPDKGFIKINILHTIHNFRIDERNIEYVKLKNYFKE